MKGTATVRLKKQGRKYARECERQNQEAKARSAQEGRRPCGGADSRVNDLARAAEGPPAHAGSHGQGASGSPKTVFPASKTAVISCFPRYAKRSRQWAAICL